ncbi:unnamed protein product [Coffea canephora]|uniref:Uncharacterized protein n=1 Tax=Coffea canephora TaxID=49390 RepID=A0A068TLD6_COFCA|nr:unnamed protein product [Coffea canephora]
MVNMNISMILSMDNGNIIRLRLRMTRPFFLVKRQSKSLVSGIVFPELSLVSVIWSKDLAFFTKKFTDENGQRQHVWQTSWAISKQFVGGTIMIHGDGTSLMLPPNLAPIQVFKNIFYWFYFSDCWFCFLKGNEVSILKRLLLLLTISYLEVILPSFSTGSTLRIEIGSRDVSTGTVVISRRDIPGKEGKDFGYQWILQFLLLMFKGWMGFIVAC